VTSPNGSNSAVTPASTSTPLAATPGTQIVRVESPDKVVLLGTYFEVAKPGSPALLLLHQWQSDRHSYDDLARRMQSKGFAVLTVDGRGFGESTKTVDGKAVQPERTDAAVKGMLGDIGAAIDLLSKQKNVDPAKIGIVGASYGSSLAILYAADQPKIAAVALLSPGINYFGNMPTEPAVSKYGVRPLLMFAADDDKESADAVNKLKTIGAGVKIEADVFPSGGHGTALFKSRPESMDIIEAFFIKSLGTHE